VKLSCRWVALSVLFACGAPSREVNVPANTAAAASPGPCDLAWIDGAERVRVSERTDGHEGWFEFEIELRRAGGEFAGTATASYRAQEQAPPTRRTLEIHVSSARVDAVLAAMRTSFDHPPDPDDAKRVFMHDSWHTVRLSIELSAATRARLTTDEGHVHPQPWHLDGCDRKLPHVGRKQFENAYGKLEEMIGRQPLFDALAQP